MAKRSKKQPDSPAGEPVAAVLETLKEQNPTLKTAAELSPPSREAVEPIPETARPRPAPQNGQEYPSFAEKVAQQRRPTAPRKRDGEPANYFASDSLRMSHDGHTHQLEVVKGELTGVQKDRLANSGFHAVDDEEKVWNATQRELNRRNTDANLAAFEIGKGRGR